MKTIILTKKIFEFKISKKRFYLELLLAITILAIMLIIVLTSLSIFFRYTKVVAANNEVAAIKTAAIAYLADSVDREFPPSSSTLVTGGYLINTPKAIYTINIDTGAISAPNPNDWGANLVWNADKQSWSK